MAQATGALPHRLPPPAPQRMCNCSKHRDRCRQVTRLGTSFEQAPGYPQAGGPRPSCCHPARVKTWTAPTRLPARQVPDAMGQFPVIHSAGRPLLRLPLENSESIVLKDAACKFSAASRLRAITGHLGTARPVFRPGVRSVGAWSVRRSARLFMLRRAGAGLAGSRGSQGSRGGLSIGLPSPLSSDKRGDNFGTSWCLSTARGPRLKLLSVGPHDNGGCAHRVVGTLMP